MKTTKQNKINNIINNKINNKINKAPVIVIMIESLRRDIVDKYPQAVPFMLEIISNPQTIFFDKSYATASHSNYADISFWYSQYPLKTKKFLSFPKDERLRSDSIFKVFHKLNYKTAYISSQNEKWGNMINWLKVPEVDYFFHSENYQKKTWFNRDDQEGLAKLIKSKFTTAGKVEDTQTVKVAKEWLEKNKSHPFFLGINLQNTHFSYVIPDKEKTPFVPYSFDFPAIYYKWPKEKVDVVRNRYLNALFNIDFILKDFVKFLKNEGIWDKCYFVLLGDSGEAFYEHGFGNHSGPMYDEVVRTLSVIKTPFIVENTKIYKPISHIDLIPTLLDLMSIDSPSSFQGVSALKKSSDSPVFLHTKAMVHQDGVVLWPYKFLITFSPTPFKELYDLSKDPFEKNNIVLSNKEVAKKLLSKITKWKSIQHYYYSNSKIFKKYYLPRTFD